MAGNSREGAVKGDQLSSSPGDMRPVRPMGEVFVVCGKCGLEVVAFIATTVSGSSSSPTAPGRPWWRLPSGEDGGMT